MPPFDTDAYRYPHEQLILSVTLLLVLLVIAITSTATFCGSALFTAVMVGLAYFATASKHKDLLSHADPVTAEHTPQLAAVVEDAALRLRPGPVQTFVVPSNTLNAYTFGLSSPKVVVLNSSLLQVMSASEIKFIVGHELGHVRLGHTWLNSLVGGMSGIPSPYGAAIVLRLAFLGWNRACEYSADRAGLLACGALNTAISALVKIETGGRYPAGGDSRALQPLAYEDVLVEDVGDLFSTHPGARRRIEHLRQYAQSDEYRRLQAQLNQNASG
jgi:Zn-dependent protease with chaperone function